ncbi:MAG: CP12 domain-containing protein [Synechococcaceae cyanobacterium]|nr:CP12 domain-containing protein [Synechococcaceae cyanobacterium]
MATIAEQLQAYRSELEQAQANGHEASARKIEQQLRELEAFQQRHPEEQVAPSAMEVFCDLNPSNVECRVYDD